MMTLQDSCARTQFATRLAVCFVLNSRDCTAAVERLGHEPIAVIMHAMLRDGTLFET
jgi:hypothetical protein